MPWTSHWNCDASLIIQLRAVLRAGAQTIFGIWNIKQELYDIICVSCKDEVFKVTPIHMMLATPGERSVMSSSRSSKYSNRYAKTPHSCFFAKRFSFIFRIPGSLAQICFDWLYQLTFLRGPLQKHIKTLAPVFLRCDFFLRLLMIIFSRDFCCRRACCQKY